MAAAMSLFSLLSVVVCGAAPPELPAPAVPLELAGGSWVLELSLDPAAPKGTLRRDGYPYALLTPKLVLLSSTPSMVGFRAEYRLTFSVDDCENAAPTPPGRWPGLCGYVDGGARPVRLAPHEVLITRTRTKGGDTVVDMVSAACVPTSGEGPSCKVEGSVAELSGGKTRTRNGKMIDPQPK